MNTTRWAESIFGDAELGDERRTKRLVQMARQAVMRPAGRVTQVFSNAGQRQAAYDFLEHDAVSPAAIGECLFRSTARASSQHERVLVAIDGTSVTVVDEAGTKGFGTIGTFEKGAHGLKLVNALAMSVDGTPIGVADQIWWSRHAKLESYSRYRSKDERESRYWREAIERIGARYRELCPTATLHFLADRESDASYTLKLLLQSEHEFTIRSNGTRRVLCQGKRRDVRRVLRRERPLGIMTVVVPANSERPERVARLEVRAAQVPMVFRDHFQRSRRVIPITVVWAREQTHRADRIEWLLLTNVPATRGNAFTAIRHYTMRWRIEDFHKTWKSGACRVEDTQLRSASAVMKWATILAAVASRIERLRRRCREEPDAPASSEFNADELDALLLLKTELGGKHEVAIEDLTILQVTRWTADLGGYVGTRSSGPPGATTIGRGLQRIAEAAELIAFLRAQGRLR